MLIVAIYSYLYSPIDLTIADFVNRILVQKQLNDCTLVERLNIIYINDKIPTYYLVCPQENKNNPEIAFLYNSILQLFKIK